jgi:hypothetical protein
VIPEGPSEKQKTTKEKELRFLWQEIWASSKKGIGDTKERHLKKPKNVSGVDKVFRELTLESLDPLLQLNCRRTIIVRRIFPPTENKSKTKRSEHCKLFCTTRFFLN